MQLGYRRCEEAEIANAVAGTCTTGIIHPAYTIIRTNTDWVCPACQDVKSVREILKKEEEDKDAKHADWLNEISKGQDD